MSDCIFCRIVKKEIPATIIDEDERFLAFLDVRPWTAGHTLVIPKQHHDYLFDYAGYPDIMAKAQDIAARLKEATGAKRIGMAVEGFEVHHAHVHLIPLHTAGDFNPANSRPATSQELQEMRKKIQNL